MKTKPVTAGSNSSLAHAESQSYTVVSAPSVTGLVLNGDSDYRWDSVLVLDNIQAQSRKNPAAFFMAGK